MEICFTLQGSAEGPREFFLFTFLVTSGSGMGGGTSRTQAPKHIPNARFPKKVLGPFRGRPQILISLFSIWAKKHVRKYVRKTCGETCVKTCKNPCAENDKSKIFPGRKTFWCLQENVRKTLCPGRGVTVRSARCAACMGCGTRCLVHSVRHAVHE